MTENMNSYLSRNLPIITPAIQFFPKNLGPAPDITSQIDFENRISMSPQNELGAEDDMTDLFDVPAPEKTPDDNGFEELDIFDTFDMGTLNNSKIPKPAGEPGRPRSGGYSLEETLGKWGQEVFQAVNVRDYDLIETKS
jgi:hypothetical protein